MNNFDMYTTDSSLRIAATNIPAFYELLEKADKQAKELQATINKLNGFYFNLEISTGTTSNQRESIDSASSNTSILATKL